MTDNHRYPIFDGHNDTLLNLYKPERGQGRNFFERSEFGHIDLPRAQEARLNINKLLVAQTATYGEP